MDAGGRRTIEEAVIEAAGEQHEAEGLMGMGAEGGSGGEEGGVPLQPLDIGFSRAALDLQDIDLLRGDDNRIGAGAAMGHVFHGAADGAMERALGRATGRAGLEACKDSLAVYRA